MRLSYPVVQPGDTYSYSDVQLGCCNWVALSSPVVQPGSCSCSVVQPGSLKPSGCTTGDKRKVLALNIHSTQITASENNYQQTNCHITRDHLLHQISGQ